MLGKRALYEKSGHLDKFERDMFPPMSIGDDQVMLRPANCPHHALIYAADHRSYRDLPLRLNELAPMFRAERSGVLSGLTRVRQINLDDTHVFCRPDQVDQEIQRGLRAALRAQNILGLPIDHVRLSLPDSSSGRTGDDARWSLAIDQLRAAACAVLVEWDLDLVEAPGEAAFYGPKLDIQVSDGHGRRETIATVQVDIIQPERFGLTYVGPDGAAHRPVMVHCGTVGSMERVTAILLEHHAGRLPFWLAPTHIAVLPVSVEQDSAAREFVERIGRRGVRGRVDHDGSLAARIRRARTRRDHLIGVIGSAEDHRHRLRITDIAGGRRFDIDRNELADRLADAYRQRRRHPKWDGIEEADGIEEPDGADDR